MNNLSLLDQIVSVEEVVRNYRTIFDWVKKSKKPLLIFKRNVPDVALVDIDWLRSVEEKLREFEEERILKMVKQGRKEFKEGEKKVLKSITSLIKS